MKSLVNHETNLLVKVDSKLRQSIDYFNSIDNSSQISVAESFESVNSDLFGDEQTKIESRIKDIKSTINNEQIWHRLTTVFRSLAAPRVEGKEENRSYLSLFWLTEKSIRQNFQKVFEHKCDILARIMYLKMAKSMDHAKIDFIRFVEVFIMLLDEIKDNRNRCVFDLLDIKGKGVLDFSFLL